MTGREDVSTYRVGRAAVLAPIGAGLILVGAVLAVAGVLGFPGWARLVVLPVAGVGWVVASGLVLWRPPAMMTLTVSGYRIHRVRGNPTASARWRDVTSVETGEIAGSSSVVVRLSDGRTSYVPIGLLGLNADAAERDLREHLNVAYGYRSLDG